MCCSPWGRKESDTTDQLNWTEQFISLFRASLNWSKTFWIFLPNIPIATKEMLLILIEAVSTREERKCLHLPDKWVTPWNLPSLAPALLTPSLWQVAGGRGLSNSTYDPARLLSHLPSSTTSNLGGCQGSIYQRLPMGQASCWRL